jgi:hypothetical protein
LSLGNNIKIKRLFRRYFQITEQVEKLKALKLELGEDAASPGGKLILKTAKGTSSDGFK